MPKTVTIQVYQTAYYIFTLYRFKISILVANVYVNNFLLFSSLSRKTNLTTENGFGAADLRLCFRICKKEVLLLTLCAHTKCKIILRPNCRLCARDFIAVKVTFKILFSGEIFAETTIHFYKYFL